MLVILGLTLMVSAVSGQMHPMPPPPPYHMYGPVSPYAPMPMMAPPMQQMQQQYPASTSVSYSGYPMMAPAAAVPYPAYGAPPPPPPSQPMMAPPPPSQPMMYPPPYQTFSGSGPMGDPFQTTTGGGFFNARALGQFLGLRRRR